MSTKVTSVFSILIFLVLAALVSLQVLEYKYYDGTLPSENNPSVWPPK